MDPPRHEDYVQPKRSPVIHILRHGQSLHNVDRNYSSPDPPLTDGGKQQAQAVSPVAAPDLVIISPMTRTIQTALLAFGSTITDPSSGPTVQIWPDLREAHGAICNKGVPRASLASRFPQFDYAECHEEWDYPDHSAEEAEVRAERVRKRLTDLSSSHENIYLVTHRGFIAFLVQGERFNVCECRRYRFATEEEIRTCRYGVNRDTELPQDFGPSLLLPLEDDKDI